MVSSTRISLVGAGVAALLLSACDIVLVSIQSPADSSLVSSSTVPFDFTIAGASGSVTYLCQLDGAPERSCVSGDAYTEVPDGTHALTVNVTDEAGRRGTKTTRFQVDTRDTFPKVTLDSPLHGSTLASADVTLAFSIARSLPSDTILCGLDSGPRIPCTSPHVFASVTNGLHSVTVSANSPGGWSTFRTVTVLVNASNTLTPVAVAQIASGGYHTCALLANGKVRCWGDNGNGQLGYGNFNDVSEAIPASLGNVNVGAEVVGLTAGERHTCALLRGGSVRCWGSNQSGQLGYLHPDEYIGGIKLPASAGDVNLGGNATQLSAGSAHTCALLQDGNVRCWGNNILGELGYGNTENVGVSVSPASAGNVNVGARAVQIDAGDEHTCALLDSGKVRCWGYNDYGQLGYGNTANVGDDEAPMRAGDVNVGGPVKQIAAGGKSTCALLTNGQVRCWGWAPRAGDIFPSRIGDDELPSSAAPVNVGGTVLAIDVGGTTQNALMCALLATGATRCWGVGGNGTLGYERPGTDLVPFAGVAARGDIRVGRVVQRLSTGGGHTCVVVAGGVVRCWGRGDAGQLGYASKLDIGDDEPPSSAGDVLVGFDLP